MAIRPILIAPDPRLKQKSKPVAVVDDEIRRLIDDMFETMYDAPGIGLAAPQIGALQRVVVVDCAREGDPKAPIALVNPEIVWVSDEDYAYDEGCLSVPEHYAEVIRPAAVRVRHLDRNGKVCEVEASGLLSVALQHEMDHLDGILFIDKLSSLKRNMILRKLQKSRRQTS